MLPLQSFNQINGTRYGQQFVKQQSPIVPFYPTQNDLYPTGYNTGPSHPFATNRPFVNNPVMDGFRQRLFGSRQGAGERRLVNVEYTEWVTVKMINTESVLPTRQRRNQPFPQKFPPSAYQGYAGPLSVPPFLFNCAVQPACLPPLPPPLPYFASFGFRNDGQCHSNPSAFYSVTPNWQTFQPMMPNYPLIPPTFQMPHYPNIVIPQPSSSWNQSISSNTAMPYPLHNPLDLPPGSTLIMDEYIDRHDVRRRKDHRRKRHKRKPPVEQFVEQSTMNVANHSSRLQSGKLSPLSEIPETLLKARNQELFDHSKNITYSRPSYNLQTNGAIKAVNKNSTERDYNVNVSSHSDTLRDIRLSLAKRDNQVDRSPAVPTISSKEEEKTNSSTYPSSSLRSESKTTKTVSMIESDITKQSFSTFRPNSRSTFLSTQDTNIDSISLASGIKSEKDNGNHLSTMNTF